MGAIKQSNQSRVSLKITDGNGVIFERIFSQFPIHIGRSTNCEVPLPQFNWISRQHLKIDMEDGQLYCYELSVNNGLKVNNTLQKKVPLTENLVLELLSIRLYIHFPKANEMTQSSLSVVSSEDATVIEAFVPQKHEHHGFLRPTISGGLEALNLSAPFPSVDRLARNRRVLEAFVTWKGQLVDSKLCRAGGNLRVGRTRESLYVPTLSRTFEIASYDGNFGECLLPEKANGFLYSTNDRKTALQDLIKGQALNKKGRQYALRLMPLDVCQLNMGHDIQLYLRYAPAPRQLSKKGLTEPDELLQKAGLFSGLFHLLFLLLVVFIGPQQHVLKVKNLSPRIAKLIVTKPKPPEPPPPEEKKPEPPKVAEQKPKPEKVPKKVQPKPKQVVVKTSPDLKKINKLPVHVKEQADATAPTKMPEKNVEALGALAALGALGAPTPTAKDQAVSINVNANAGGASSLSTTGVIGTLKSKGGKLEAGGLAGVKTTGKGFGTGTGYGVQGLQGRAGARGVQGSVIGTPSLMKLSGSEGLTQKEVMDVVKKYAGKIQQCYERALLAETGLAGRIEYQWSITPKGVVTDASVKRSDMKNADQLNECVLTVFKGMKFPPAKNGQGTTPSIGFPFGRM